MLLLASMVGLWFFQTCNFWYEADLILNHSVTSLQGRIVDTDTEMLTSANKASTDVSFDLNTECLLGNKGDEYANHLQSRSISSAETRDSSKTRP